MAAKKKANLAEVLGILEKLFGPPPTADRHEALANGEINASLCAIRAGEADDPDAGGWFSVVGANWRVATPDRGSAAAEIADLLPGSAPEPFTCTFTE